MGNSWTARLGIPQPHTGVWPETAVHASPFALEKADWRKEVTKACEMLLIWFESTSILAGGGSDPASMLEKYDHSYDRIMHRVGRPNHWRSAPTAHQGGADDVIFQLHSPL